jgi:hypothetical protein
LPNGLARFLDRRGVRIAVVAAAALLFGAAAVAAYRKGARPEDFQSWLLGGRAVLDGRDLYEAKTGGGMWFALPPWFALAMVPLAAIPEQIAVAIWVTVALAAVAACVFVGAAVVRGGERRDGLVLTLLPFLLVFRTFDSDLKLLQINSIVLALIVAGLFLVVRGAPFRGGLVLAVAAGFKLTPLLLFAYLLFTRRLRAAAGMACGVALLAVLPALWFGWTGNARLLDEYVSERVLKVSEGTESGNRVPGQSLRSITFRLLTKSVFDGTKPGSGADSRAGPRFVNFASLTNETAQLIYRAAVLGILAVLALVLRRAQRANPPSRWAFGISLVLLTMLLVSPYSRKAHFVATLPAVTACLAYLRARERTDTQFKLVAAALVLVAVLLGLSTETVMGDRLSTWLDAYASIGWATVALWAAMTAALWLDSARPPETAAADGSRV